MGKEIEKKYLLKNDSWRSLSKGTTCRQGYLNSSRERTVRIRIIDDRGFLTVKGITRDAERMEYEYEIPMIEAETMLNTLCEKPLIEKIRYRIEYRGFVWEVDEFLGSNKGLVLAEVELKSKAQHFEKPEWIGEEVTEDPKYFNSNLLVYCVRQPIQLFQKCEPLPKIICR